MAINVTVGDLRNKSKTSDAEAGRDLYSGDIPLVVGGKEAGVIRVRFNVADTLTLAQVRAKLASGLQVQFNL